MSTSRDNPMHATKLQPLGSDAPGSVVSGNDAGSSQSSPAPASSRGSRAPSRLSSVSSIAMDGPLLRERSRCSGPWARGVAVAGLVVAVAGAALIILLVSSTSKPTFTVPDRFSATFTALPRFFNASGTVQRVAGTVHKTLGADGSWIVSGQVQLTTHGSQVTTITALDERLYVVVTEGEGAAAKVVEQRCMDELSAPVLGDLDITTPAASPVDVADLQPVGGELGGCETGAAWLLTHQGQSYVVCHLGDSLAMQMVGAGFVSTLSDVDLSPPEASPYTIPTNVTSGEPMNCPEVTQYPIWRGVPTAAQRRRRLNDDFPVPPPYTAPTPAYPPAMQISDSTVSYLTSTATLSSIYGGGRRLGEASSPREAVQRRVAEVSADPAALLEEAQRINSPDFKRATHAEPAHARELKSAPVTPGDLGPLSVGTPMQLNPENAYITWFHLDQSASKTCVFMHGAGRMPKVETVRSQDETYWGSVHRRFKGCKKFAFVTLDTTNNGWDSEPLQRKFCDLVLDKLDEDDEEDRVLNDVVVFGHGMGNLIIGGALLNGHCGINFKNSAWVELQPAYPIARLAEFGRNYFCDVYQSDPSLMAQQLQEDLRLCKSVGLLNPSWESMTYEAPGLSSVSELIKKGTSASMCGFDPQGLMGSSYAGVVEQPWAPGVVVATSPKWSRCWDNAYTYDFYSYPSASRYMAAVNVLDVTCRNGDGLYDDARMPCFWMDAMVFLASGSHIN